VGISGNRTQKLAADALCLAVITWLSAAPYVFKLGFYSDDWSILSMFHFAAVQVDGFGRAFEEFPGRPLAAIYHALLFKAFGSHPLGYHLVNTTVLGSAICLLYLLLVRLRVSRAESLAAALVLIALPQLSTVRVWSAASAVNLSMLLMLVSLHAQLSYDRTRRIGWAVLAIAAAILSLGAYEIFGPFLAAFPIALVVARHRRTGEKATRGLVPTVLAVAVLCAIAILVKVVSSGRAGQIADPVRYLKVAHQLVRPDYDWRTDFGLNIIAGTEVHFWIPLVDWARSAGGLMMGQYGAVVIGSAAAAAGLSYWRLSAAGSRDTADLRPLRLLLLGCATFVLGHATFLIVPAVQFSPSGIGNRLLVAGAIGVAMILVSVIGWASRAAPPAYRASCFSAAVTLLVLCGVLRVATVAGFWVEAPQIQQRVLRAARADLHSVPAESTVVLDGVCPYHGPAPVFETWWDVEGALSLTLGRWLKGDAVSPRMRITPRGLQTSIYTEPSLYPYGPGLYVYNPNLHLAVPLANAMDARRYFGRPGRWPVKCQPSYEGHGALID